MWTSKGFQNIWIFSVALLELHLQHLSTEKLARVHSGWNQFLRMFFSFSSALFEPKIHSLTVYFKLTNFFRARGWTPPIFSNGVGGVPTLEFSWIFMNVLVHWFSMDVHGFFNFSLSYFLSTSSHFVWTNGSFLGNFPRALGYAAA